MANILDRIKQIFGSNSNGLNDNINYGRAALYQQRRISESIGDSNKDVDLKGKPETVATIYQCAKLLSEFVSRIPIDIYQEDSTGKKVLNKNHRWYYSLKYSPNDYTSTQNLISVLVTHLCFRGNAFCVINPDNTLTLLNPDDVLQAKVFKGSLYYQTSITQPDGSEQQQIIQSNQLIHLKFASKDGLFGMNPLDSLKIQANTNFKGDKTVENFFSKNASSTKYLQQLPTNGKPSNQNVKELVENFTAKIAGYANSFNLFSVPDGYQIEELGLNTELVKFLDAGRITRNQIASIYGIPVFFLNTEPNYTTKFEEQNLLFLSTIENLVNIIRSEFENKLLLRNEKLEGVCIEWNYWKLNQSNIIDKSNALKLASSAGAISPNEYARQMNLPESDNPNMELHYIQIQNVSIENIGKTQPVATTEPASTDSQPEVSTGNENNLNK